MSSARRSSEDAPINEYERQQLANISRNKQMLDALKLPTINTIVPPSRRNKRKKVDHTRAATEGHNLRPRPQRNNSHDTSEQIAPDPNQEVIGDFLCDNEDLHTQNKRKGRGITRLDDIFSRTPDMPKIKIILNEYGQPVGKGSRKLSSAIGCQVRKKLSVGCDDWRLVDAKKKLEVWDIIQAIFDLDAAAFKWFMTTAGLKWKEFKAELKQKYFDETLTDEELKTRNQVLFEENGERVNDNDWNYLIGFWRSDESKARTARAKACRAKVQLLHTSGSVSHACARHDLGEDLGRPARRDEVFIKTHTRKNGLPSSRQAASTIGELKSAVETRPELKDRTIQQGDAYAIVCGVKEPRGRVRVLGLGPSPQEIGTPGLKSYVPTRIQMEALAREKVEHEKAALEQRVKELEDQILEQRIERNAENISQHGSNSRHQVSPRSQDLGDEAHQNAQGAEIGNYEDNEDYDLSSDEEENLLGQRHVAAPSVPIMDITSPRYAHDTLVGKDVVLYAMLRSDQPVAKGTIISTNPNTRVGGQPLGKQFCEVIVNVVMKRDAILPRPYDHMESMAGAYMMSIAWPYKKLKVCNGASKSKGVAGNARCG